VVVTEVEAGSAADEAGIQSGDVILEINRKPVHNLDDFRKQVGALGKDDTVLLRIVRNGQRLFVAVNP
jgi:serine protease Do